MRCPKCGCTDSRVIDSRPSDNDEAIRRRRECADCNFRFTTYERREETPITVRKKDNSCELFNRQKVMHGLLTATVKRNIPVETLDTLIDDIIGELRDEGISEIPSAHIGDMVMKRLLELDKVAYVRFASVYREFKDPEEFVTTLKALL